MDDYERALTKENASREAELRLYRTTIVEMIAGFALKKKISRGQILALKQELTECELRLEQAALQNDDLEKKVKKLSRRLRQKKRDIVVLVEIARMTPDTKYALRRYSQRKADRSEVKSLLKRLKTPNNGNA